MLYGRKNMEERMVEAAAGTSGYAAWEALRGGFCLCPPGVFSAMLWYSKYQDHETMMVTGQLRVLLKAADCRHEGSGGQIALDKRIYYQTEKAPQDLSQSCGAFSMRNSGAEII